MTKAKHDDQGKDPRERLLRDLQAAEKVFRRSGISRYIKRHNDMGPNLTEYRPVPFFPEDYGNTVASLFPEAESYEEVAKGESLGRGVAPGAQSWWYLYNARDFTEVAFTLLRNREFARLEPGDDETLKTFILHMGRNLPRDLQISYAARQGIADFETEADRRREQEAKAKDGDGWRQRIASRLRRNRPAEEPAPGQEYEINAAGELVEREAYLAESPSSGLFSGLPPGDREGLRRLGYDIGPDGELTKIDRGRGV